jgi:hypothetical protein
LYSSLNQIEFLPYDVIIQLVSSIPGFLVAKPLITGTFDKVFNFDINFNSTIPEILGLEEFILKTNIAEGIVIRFLRCLIKNVHIFN